MKRGRKQTAEIVGRGKGGKEITALPVRVGVCTGIAAPRERGEGEGSRGIESDGTGGRIFGIGIREGVGDEDVGGAHGQLGV